MAASDLTTLNSSFRISSFKEDESVWVKYWDGKRRFWQGLNRYGPIEVDLPVRPGALMGMIDRIVVEATGRRPTAIPGGCWDIFAWRRGPSRLFLEIKEPGERL